MGEDFIDFPHAGALVEALQSESTERFRVSLVALIVGEAVDQSLVSLGRVACAARVEFFQPFEDEIVFADRIEVAAGRCSPTLRKGDSR